ncbi:hypothetical protein CCP3SC15_870006 [Gammaproteobacteria bacterium]
MLSGLYGGIVPGVLTTALSVWLVSDWSPVGQPFLRDSGDWLGAMVFAINCILISAIIEAMHHAWMDIRMPIMDGFEATRRIRTIDSKVRIVALTAHALEEERLEILKAGCDDFVRKPYREHEIFYTLTKQLGIHFRYAEQPIDTSVQSAVEANITNLCKLPLELLIELRNAIELLNQERCIEVSGMISDIDFPLGAELRQRIEIFQYTELLNLLDLLIGDKS